MSLPLLKKKSIETDSFKTSFISRVKRAFVWCLSFTPKQQLVLKCSFAYMLGSLFTFVPLLNVMIGNNRVSSHLVATATVFFNPAKSLGGMVEAAIYGWGYVLFALLICFGSMLTTDFFIDRDMLTIAHAVSLGVWLTGATFVIAFLKAHWNKPPVATASSLCFIILFIIVVREGSANKGEFNTTRIQQIVSAVATGTLITILCCVLFWPTSASKKLKKDLEATLMSYKVLLKLLTKTFLLDEDVPEFKANDSLKTAIDSHRASFTSLQKSLKEAKLEVIWNADMRECSNEFDAVVKSMQRLAQSVDGLRSSCGLQFELLLMRQDIPSMTGKGKKKAQTWHIRPDHHRRKFEGELKRQKNLQQHSSKSFTHDDTKRGDTNSIEVDRKDNEAEEGVLIEFIHTIHQPLKSLAYTCKQTIIHLQSGFSDNHSGQRNNRIRPDFHTLRDNLVKAIALFEVSQRQAVKRLNKHRRKHHHHHLPLPDTQQQEKKDNNHLLSPLEDYSYFHNPNDNAFLAYFFVFNMIEFAKELISLVESVQNLHQKKQQKAPCFFKWVWKQLRRKRTSSTAEVRKKRKVALFKPNERHKMNTLHTPVPKTKWRRMILRVWQAFSLFKLQKFRYATKATLGAVLLALPAFRESTGEWFREWRMEWALITLMVVMTPTVGGTNLVAVYRIFSTILGCFAAMCLYLVFPGNMYVLIVGTWLFSLPNFWIILHHKHGKFGQFTLLAYNLVMLNKYNDRETNRVEVTHLALQRCLAILVGVILGLFMTAYVWPYEARVELRKGVSDFLLRLAWLYQKLVRIYSKPLLSSATLDLDEQTQQQQGDRNVPASILTVNEQQQQTAQMFVELELGLQRSLLDLRELLNQTPNEPRLKGAFPVSTYSDILGSLHNLTDKLTTMRIVILKEEWYEQVQNDFIMPVKMERREMVGNILLYLYMLASAMRLKTPLPPYLPPARKAWESLVIQLRQLPVVRSQQVLEKDNICLFYYAYIMVLEDIVRELDKLGTYLTLLFGAIVPKSQWESLFEEQPKNDTDVEQNSLGTLIFNASNK
ncbi:Fusaric acid resistance protein-like-domain-containing protein [Mycotypha africana]|uniref:Fusaric acid resistance protein-like-domain-containing protein n=1 Tax=Mycotypha africana TaxID=64632 RepID=UPI002300E195|nr:Fusaric acid resistance protein-like-domain-containing protein [Mycotypha africana]KAI8979071.1 Fusaric acid resistance protein-like-domain-containing protein [Mycotypha africana]